MKTENILFLLAAITVVLTVALFLKNPLGLFFGIMVAAWFAGCGWCEKTDNF